MDEFSCVESVVDKGDETGGSVIRVENEDVVVWTALKLKIISFPINTKQTLNFRCSI